jgi:hypothetical protein
MNLFLANGIDELFTQQILLNPEVNIDWVSTDLSIDQHTWQIVLTYFAHKKRFPAVNLHTLLLIR